MSVSSKSPFVTVIVPNFNYGQFLERSLDSVLMQDYPHFECLIMDGGSTDNSLEIIQRYAATDSRIVWYSEPDNGLSHALNKAHRVAKGEIITWHCSDDTLIGQVISPTVAYFIAHPEVDFIYGDSVITDENDQPTGIYTYGKPFNLIDQLSKYITIPQHGAFWKKWIWEKLGGFDETLHYAMDTEFFMRVVEIANVAHLPGARSTYRHHPLSKSVKGDLATIQARMEITHRLLAQPEKYPELQSKRRLLDSNFAYLLSHHYWRHGEPSLARQHARQAFVKSPILRRRWPYLLLWIVDTHLGTGLSRQAESAWVNIKNRF